MWIKFFIVGVPIFEFVLLMRKGNDLFILNLTNDISQICPFLVAKKWSAKQSRATLELVWFVVVLVVGLQHILQLDGGNVVVRLG
jgi:hypothetical protein